MRIAAKRLRYVLEVTAEPCFGPYARTAAKRAKDLQDLLGEIHDCDVQLPRVERLVTSLRDADADELRRRAGDADDLDPALAARLPHARRLARPVALETYLRARRTLLYGRFLTLGAIFSARACAPGSSSRSASARGRAAGARVGEVAALGDRRAPVQVVAPPAANPATGTGRTARSRSHRKPARRRHDRHVHRRHRRGRGALRPPRDRRSTSPTRSSRSIARSRGSPSTNASWSSPRTRPSRCSSA